MSMSAALERIRELECELRRTKHELASVEQNYRQYRNTIRELLQTQGSLKVPQCES